MLFRELKNQTRRQKASAVSTACAAAIEPLEQRLLMAAHIVGSTTVYSTIQAAVNAASAGAVINVDAGTYAEEVTITKSLTIRGAEAGIDARLTSRLNGPVTSESILSGAVSGSVHSASFYINANDVTIDGFTVQGETDQTSQVSAGIVIAPSRSGTHILNNIIQNNVSGVFLANNSSTDAALLQFNVFRNNNNDGLNGGRGIYTDQTISGGNLTNVTIDSNAFTNNYGGNLTTNLEAACAFQATVAGEQSNIRITNNAMTGNGKAVLFFNATTVFIEGNTITTTRDQYSGTLRFEGNDHDVTIEYNTAFKNTGPAVAVDSKGAAGNSSGFVVNFNNFYSNNTAYATKISLVYSAADYDGTFDARYNWWGNANGPSGDGPGAGDAVSAGQMQIGNGLGWALLPGGSLLYSPWSAALNATPGLLPTAPIALNAVTAGVTQVNLSWTDTAFGFETGFVIQRSIDGTNFTQVGTSSMNVDHFVDTTAVGGTTYTYEVAAINANGTSSFSAVAATTTPAVGSITTSLSSVNWVSAVAGYGTVQKNLSIGGNTLTIGTATYSSGIGTHAASQIVYNLAGRYTNFISDIGVDSEENGKGTGMVDFQVVGDGQILYDSGILTNPGTAVSINVNVTNVTTLTLIASNGIPNVIDYDHADWAGAKLISSGTLPPTAPLGLSAVAISPTQINLAWTNSDRTATGAVIQRSTDGVNFVQVGAVAANLSTYSDTTAAGGTAYTYRVAAINAFGTSAFSAMATATTPAAGAITTNLSTLNWVSATAGWNTVQKNKSINGNPIILNGVAYPSGIGTHAVSNIVYNLSGGYTNFLADIGIDGEEKANGGAVDFKVLGDNGAVLYDSGVLTNLSATVSINVNVTGVQTMTLVATNGIAGNIDFDHADWAGARLLSSPSQAPIAPSGLTGLAVSSSQVNLAWSNNAGNAAGFVIQRSTDGVNFAQIGTTTALVTTFTDTAAVAGTANIYRVAATNAGGASAFSPTFSVTTPVAGAISTNLSTLNWVSATAGWNSVQKNLSINDNPLTLNGVTYASGIGTHAVSNIVYNLGGAYTNFLTDIGIDGEEKANGGAVDFKVLGDNGAVLYDSGVLTNLSATVSININVAGVQTMTLVATNGIAGNIDYDHADWAGARLLSSPSQAPIAPTGLAGVAISATQANLNWTNNAPNATGVIIQRSTDGVTFTQIASLAAGVSSFSDTAAIAGAANIYEVAAMNSAGTSAFTAPLPITTPAAGAISTNLSDLTWVSATAGFNTVQKNHSILGNAITLHGVVYASGIGTHASSTIVYNLAGGYTNFISDIGIDAEEYTKGTGSVDFKVLGDGGAVLFDSGVLTNASPTMTINVNVTGVQTLTLVAANGVAGSIDYDHADWAGARLLSTPAGGTGTMALAHLQIPAIAISAARIVNAAAPSVPSPWADATLGAAGQLGNASSDGSSFTVQGVGSGIGATADALNYVYQPLSGNGTIIAHLDTAQTAGDEAGLLIRETLGAGAKNVDLLITSKGVRFAHRAKTGGNAVTSAKAAKVTPAWLKIVRKGIIFTAFDSTDGVHWEKAGSTKIKMNTEVEFGFGAASGASTTVNASVFSDISVTAVH